MLKGLPQTIHLSCGHDFTVDDLPGTISTTDCECALVHVCRPETQRGQDVPMSPWLKDTDFWGSQRGFQECFHLRSLDDCQEEVAELVSVANVSLGCVGNEAQQQKAYPACASPAHPPKKKTKKQISLGWGEQAHTVSLGSGRAPYRPKEDQVGTSADQTANSAHQAAGEQLPQRGRGCCRGSDQTQRCRSPRGPGVTLMGWDNFHLKPWLPQSGTLRSSEWSHERGGWGEVTGYLNCFYDQLASRLFFRKERSPYVS
jgi:hypothetical protein